MSVDDLAATIYALSSGAKSFKDAANRGVNSEEDEIQAS